jgi:tRNA 2-selenouridine synthase
VRIPTLAYDDARRLRGARWVDLRSPAEHAHDRIPGALNAPLLDNQQRAIVGTLYKQVSPDAAYDQGLGFAASGMPEMLQRALGHEVPRSEWEPRFAELSRSLRSGSAAVRAERVESLPDNGAGAIILHCWRGGMRSRSVAALLQALGQPVALLEGGYKSYRSWILARLAAWPPPGPNPFLVISGATGTGKTLLLRELEAAAPGTVLDLEDLAQHRSSILGGVGKTPVSQAAFESRLVARVQELGPPPWFIEAESRKVGDVILPPSLWSAMRAGFVIELSASAARRVRILVDDYLEKPANAAEIALRLPFLEQRLGAAWEGRLSALLAGGAAPAVARAPGRAFPDGGVTVEFRLAHVRIHRHRRSSRNPGCT